MARFLSSEWFDQVEAASEGNGGPTGIVLQQVVTGTPDGDVSYQVVVAGGRARIRRATESASAGYPAEPGPAITITAAWDTAVAIAQGRLSTQRALMDGRLRIRGGLAGIAGGTAGLAGLDAIPLEVRQATTY